MHKVSARPATPPRNTSRTTGAGSPLEVLRVALRLGLTSFGGPVAHLGYFHAEYVVRRRWLDEGTYADLVALCQFLPGPASSELGIAIGMRRAGLLGGLAAWLGFTLPSALALVLFAYAVHAAHAVSSPWLHGLQLAAVAVVAQAVWTMGGKLTPDRPRIGMALLAAGSVLAWPGSATQVLVIVLAGVLGWRFLAAPPTAALEATPSPVRRPLALGAWAVLLLLLLGLPLLSRSNPNGPIAVFDAFFRSGALVFGGGHVVLPLLQAAVVAPHWVGNGQFLTGYGAAQAVPGPLFTFSAYLGYVMKPAPHGLPGAGLALAGIFLPAFLLVIGTLPFWDGLRGHAAFRSALAGINAAVVGILLAALYHPIWTSAVRSAGDVVVALLALGLLMWWTLPPWAVVLFAAVAGGLETALR